MSDFLRTLPSCNPLSLWAWPTLSQIDYQLVIWLFTFLYRRQTLHKIESQGSQAGGADEEPMKASGPGELDNTTYTTPQARPRKGVEDSALLEMLGGYYDRAKAAVFFTLLLRLGTGSILTVWGMRRLRSRLPPGLWSTWCEEP